MRARARAQQCRRVPATQHMLYLVHKCVNVYVYMPVHLCMHVRAPYAEVCIQACRA